MKDKKVISIIDIINRKKEKHLENVKKELNRAIDNLDISIEDILNSFVNPQLTPYNNKDIEDNKDITLTYVKAGLKINIDVLNGLGLEEAAKEIEAVLIKLNNNFYWDGNEN